MKPVRPGGQSPSLICTKNLESSTRTLPFNPASAGLESCTLLGDFPSKSAAPTAAPGCRTAHPGGLFLCFCFGLLFVCEHPTSSSEHLHFTGADTARSTHNCSKLPLVVSDL